MRPSQAVAVRQTTSHRCGEVLDGSAQFLGLRCTCRNHVFRTRCFRRLQVRALPRRKSGRQSASVDEGRERREGRAGGRVRVEGDQAASGGVQCGCGRIAT
jgi:hypothetical protein